MTWRIDTCAVIHLTCDLSDTVQVDPSWKCIHLHGIRQITQAPLNCRSLFAKELCKRDYVLQKRPMILRSLCVLEVHPLARHQTDHTSSLKPWVSFAKEPYKRDYILQKRSMILRSLCVLDLGVDPLARDQTDDASDESRHTYEWVTSHVWLRHITCMSKSRQKGERGTSKGGIKSRSSHGT